MKKLTTLLLLTGLAGHSLLLTSCGNKNKDDETAGAPVALLVPETETKTARHTVAAKPTPAPLRAPNPAAADSTAAFLVPKSDTNLPTAEQLEEGKASSIGTKADSTKNVTASANQPSTAIKPPTSVKPTKDDLAPAE